MALGAQKTIGIRYGKCTATTRVMILASLTNTAMTVSCNGSSYPVTLNQVGADRGTNDPAGVQYVGYSGSVEITGLAEGESYSYTVTQGANTLTGTISPFYASAADFSFFVVSCDKPGITGDPHLYGTIREYANTGTLPCVGIMHCDDIGYIDASSIDDTGYSGKRQICEVNGVTIAEEWLSREVTQYDYVTCYFAYLGLLGNSANNDIAFGRDEDRVWCRENLAFFPQWGNHDFGGASQYYVPTVWSASTAMHKTDPATGGWDGNGRLAWNAMMNPIEPTSIVSTDLHSKPWGITLGNTVHVIATDWLSNKNQAGTALFGNAQIDDMITAMNNSTPFKLLLMAPQIRTFITGDTGGSAGVMSSFASELSRLFTSTAVNSVMQSSTTNGRTGMTAAIHNDLHHAYVCCHRAAAFASNNAELYYSINPGTVNESSGHTFTPKIGDVGNTYSGGAVVAGSVGDTLEYAETYNSEAHIVRVDVYGTKAVPEMVINLINASGIVWQKKWLARSSNDSFDVSWESSDVLIGGGL